MSAYGFYRLSNHEKQMEKNRIQKMRNNPSHPSFGKYEPEITAAAHKELWGHARPGNYSSNPQNVAHRMKTFLEPKKIEIAARVIKSIEEPVKTNANRIRKIFANGRQKKINEEKEDRLKNPEMWKEINNALAKYKNNVRKINRHGKTRTKESIIRNIKNKTKKLEEEKKRTNLLGLYNSPAPPEPNLLKFNENEKSFLSGKNYKENASLPLPSFIPLAPAVMRNAGNSAISGLNVGGSRRKTRRSRR